MPRRVKDRKTKGEAQALAKEIRSQLKRGEIGLVHRASKEEAELLSLWSRQEISSTDRGWLAAGECSSNRREIRLD